MATYTKVETGGKIYERKIQREKEASNQQTTASGNKITRRNGKTYVTNSRGKEIELTTSRTEATPEAATVLKDIKHSDVNKVKVVYNKSKMEVTPEQYESYKRDPKTFYQRERLPEPTRQSYPTATLDSNKKVKGIQQWSRGTQANIRMQQEYMKRTMPYAENSYQARYSQPKKPQGQPIPWKTRDPKTGVLTPTIAYRTTTPVKPQDNIKQPKPEPKRDWLSKQIYKIDKNVQSKLPKELQENYKYKSAKETRARLEAQPEPKTSLGKFRTKVQGAALKVKEEIEYKPLKTGVNIALGAATGGISKIGLAKGVIVRSVTKGSLIAGTTIYGGVKTVDYITAPTQLKKGEVIGGTVKEVAEFGVGYKLGGGFGTKTTKNKFTEQPSKPSQQAPPSKPKSSTMGATNKQTTKEPKYFNPSEYINPIAKRYKNPLTGKTEYIYEATSKEGGKSFEVTKKQFGQVTVETSINKIKLGGKKGTYRGFNNKGLTTSTRSIVTYKQPTFNLGVVASGSLVVAKKQTSNIVTRPKTNLIKKSKNNIVNKPKTDLITKPRYNIITKPKTNIITRPTSNIITKPKYDVTTRPSYNIIKRPTSNIVTRPRPIEYRPRPPKPGEPWKPEFKIPGLPSGWFKGIGGGGGYGGSYMVGAKGSQKKKYTAGAWEAAFGIKGKKSGTFTGIGLRPIATN